MALVHPAYAQLRQVTEKAAVILAEKLRSYRHHAANL